LWESEKTIDCVCASELRKLLPCARILRLFPGTWGIFSPYSIMYGTCSKGAQLHSGTIGPINIFAPVSRLLLLSWLSSGRRRLVFPTSGPAAGGFVFCNGFVTTGTCCHQQARGSGWKRLFLYPLAVAGFHRSLSAHLLCLQSHSM
jgi:hypothetical protein